MLKFRNLLEEEPLRAADGDDNRDSGEVLAQARSASERLLAAGDEAIRRALSAGNSEAFLEASRQQGGE